MKERCEILLAIALCCYSCSPTSNSEGQYNESYLSNVDYLTSHRPLDEGDVVDVQGLIFTEAGLLANQKFVDKDRSSIAAYDTGGLSKLWEWTEAYDDYGIDGFRGGGHSVRQYVYNGTLITYERNILFKLDLNDGRTIVKAKFDNTLVGLDGVGNFAPTAYTVSDLDERIGYIDIETQGYIEIDAHTVTAPYRAGVNTPTIFFHNEHPLLVYVTVDWLPGTLEEHYWLNLYDIDRGEKVWKSDSIPVVLPGGNMGNRIRYSNGKLILANNMLYAYNVEDGTLVWSRDYGNSFVLSSHPIVAEGRVYANNDSGFMVCLDVETGRQIWRTETGGSPSPIVHHDGRIYMSNVTQPGGNSLLVIDALTGEILYDVVAPYDPDVDPSPLFNDAIAVDPETGYVYTGNYRDLLVYDFP